MQALSADLETMSIPVLLGIELPPPDAYDKYPGLVPRHFSPTPELTNVDKAYTKYGNSYQKEKWRPISIQAKSSAQRLYSKHGLARNIRFKCGLYIVGSETDMQDKDRDRMMVLVFELSLQQLSFWNVIHTDAMKLLDELGLSDEPGVCVRYYYRAERSPIADMTQPWQSTRPNADSSITRHPDDRMSSREHEETAEERMHRAFRRYNDEGREAYNQRVTMSESARSLSSMMSFEEQIGQVERNQALTDLPYGVTTVSAERSTAIRHPGRPQFAYMSSTNRRRTTRNPGSGITHNPGSRTTAEAMQAYRDLGNSFVNSLRRNSGAGSAEDGTSSSDSNGATDVAIQSTARNTDLRYYDEMGNPRPLNPFTGRLWNRWNTASSSDADRATNVSVQTTAGSDEEEEPLVPPVSEPAIEYR